MRTYQKMTAVALALSVGLTGCSNGNKEVKAQEVVVEYGKAISVNPADYFKKESKDALKNIKLDSKTKIENEKGKSYPSVGEYTLTFNNTNKNAKEKTMTVKVIVKDSVKPTFVDVQEEYKVKVGDKLKVELFNVEDVSKVTVTLDDSKVDYSKEGSYQATLKAVDTSKNETTKDIKVVVSAEAKSVDEQVKEAEAKAPAPTPSASTNSSSQQTSYPTSKPSTPTPSTPKPTTPSKPSKPSGGSSTTTKPSKPSKPSSCDHQWMTEYDYVWHDPVYKTESQWIVDQAAYEKPIYNTIEKIWCYGCNEYYTADTDAEIIAHLTWHQDRGDRIYNYRFDEIDEIVGYETVPEQGHYEDVQVVVKDGYTEKVVSRVYCPACGAEK